MLISGLNDTEEALRAIAAALRQIRPDAVHINLPIRPPTETWVQPPDAEGLMRAVAILGDTATARGTVLVDGPGSEWAVAALTVSDPGDGQLTISNGGLVHSAAIA